MKVTNGGDMKVDYIKQGDCTKLIKELPSKSIDVLFTSPPYNRKRNDTYRLFDDINDNYFDLLCLIADEGLRVVRDKVIINIQQNFYNKEDFYNFMGEYSKHITGMVVWCKTNPQPCNNYREKDNTRSVTNAFEYFIFLTKSGSNFRSYGKDCVYNYVTSSINSQHSDIHGAIMKQEISDWFIERFTKEGDIVLDPFCGLGTTGVSCKKMNRHFIGFEIVKEYCIEAVKRIRKVKGDIWA